MAAAGIRKWRRYRLATPAAEGHRQRSHNWIKSVVGGKLRQAWGEGSSAQDGASRATRPSLASEARRSCREQGPARLVVAALIGWGRPCDWPCLPCEMRGCLAKIIFRHPQACLSRVLSAWTAGIAALCKGPP
jgi:hypothetical protein